MSSNTETNNLKVALVTGATNKLGTAIAILLSKCGFQLVITDSDEKELSKVTKFCEESAKYANKWQMQSGKWVKTQRTVAFAVDYKSDTECRRVIDSMINIFGRIDLLVNYCSYERRSDLSDTKFMDIYDEVIAIELRPIIFFTHLTVPYLELTNGNIINVFKSSAIKPDQFHLANCMANSAARMFTECLALEMGPKGVRINSITHSNVSEDQITGLEVNQQMMDELVERLEKNNNLCRLFTSQDVARAVFFLASKGSDFISGINLVVDGGTLI